MIIGLELGLKHINAGWIFSSASIKIPFNLIGGKAEPIKLAWMYMSLPVGIVFLISVNIELILRNFLSNFTKLELPEDLDKQKLETELTKEKIQIPTNSLTLYECAFGDNSLTAKSLV